MRIHRLLQRHYSGVMRDHYSGGGAKACRVEGVVCWKEVIGVQLLVPSVSKIKRPAEPHKQLQILVGERCETDRSREK